MELLQQCSACSGNHKDKI